MTTPSEMRHQGLVWMWGTLGVAFTLWFVLGLLWPPAQLKPQDKGLILGGRLAIGVFLLAGVGVLFKFRKVDLVSMGVEWAGFLVLVLFTSISGAILDGGFQSPSVAFVALLIVARGLLLPGGLRGFLPSAVLLLVMYDVSLMTYVVFVRKTAVAMDPFVFSHMLLFASMMLGTWAAWNNEENYKQLSQSDRLGRYKEVREISSTGMSTVLFGWNLLLDQACVIKKVPVYASNIDGAVEEFRREAELTMRIQNPHVVRLFDFGDTEDDLYFVMEYLDGINLNALLKKKGPLPQRRVIHLLQQTCLGLAAIHRQGILHQDLKPSNLFLTLEEDKADFLKILDFGIARRIDATEEEQDARGRGKNPGTPAYMAPERFEGISTVESEIYAMGAIFYALLTGTPPFRAKTISDYKDLHQHMEPSVDKLVEQCPDLVPSAQDVILKALSKNPQQRYQNADEMWRALKQCEKEAGPWTAGDANAAWEALRPPAQDDGDISSELV